ncbi:MAG TPA: hypothetical protein PLS23_11360, partial [Phycisphaerae bacterium]|nr:hypothetical protein [Phycisphaerae bacterium]
GIGSVLPNFAASRASFRITKHIAIGRLERHQLAAVYAGATDGIDRRLAASTALPGPGFLMDRLGHGHRCRFVTLDADGIDLQIVHRL